jgi:hypothetical protein
MRKSFPQLRTQGVAACSLLTRLRSELTVWQDATALSLDLRANKANTGWVL